MIKTKLYKAIFTDKKTGKIIKPEYVIGNAKNKNDFKIIAKYSYYDTLEGRGTDYINKAMKNVKITVEEVKKRKPLSARLVTTKVKKPFKKSPTGASKQVANFPIRNKPGAYIIFEGKKVIYVGYGKNVYMAMYRHFYPYRDKLPQSRVYFENKEKLKCQVIYTKTASQAHKLEIALIFKYNPPLNLNKYKGFEADESEKKILTEYYLTPSKDIEIYKGDIPF